MGKALVIKGLKVTNPISQITLITDPVAHILSDYYTAVGSDLTNIEKNALETFISTVYEEGLWDKFKYFYPFMGSTVANQITEVISPSTDDIMATIDDTVVRSVSADRMLQIKGGDTVPVVKSAGSRLAAINGKKIGTISAWNFKEELGGRNHFTVGLYGSDRFTFFRLNNRFGSLQYYNNGNQETEQHTYSNYETRLFFACAETDKIRVFKNNTLIAADDDCSDLNETFTNTYGVLTWSVVNEVQKSINYQIPILAITEGLTSTEWQNVVYPAVNKFLTSLGRIV